MKRAFFCCLLAVAGLIAMQSATSAIDLPPVLVDLPAREDQVAVETKTEICVDGSCSSVAVSVSGDSCSKQPVRKLLRAQPVRRLFHRARHCCQ